jgi:tRNA 2-thiouridine synthesizing protein B
MPVLHTLNQSPSGDALPSCLRCLGPGDKLLLLEDAVYAACDPYIATLRDAGVDCYVLEADADARGIRERLDASITPVDYGGFVELAVACDSVQSWY